MQPPAHTPDYRAAAKSIDHSLLRPELTPADVRAGCKLALDYDVASVCCRPTDVALCAELLSGSGVQVGTVIGGQRGDPAEPHRRLPRRQGDAVRGPSPAGDLLGSARPRPLRGGETLTPSSPGRRACGLARSGPPKRHAWV